MASYAERARESEYIITENGTLVVKKAVLIWRNFSGAPTRVNPKGGVRGFSLVVTPEVAADLKATGWNIKEKASEGFDTYWQTDIAVNLNAKYPIIYILHTEFNGKKVKCKMELSELDKLDKDILIDSAYVVIRPNPSTHDDGSVTYKGYLQQIEIVERKRRGYFSDVFDENEVEFDATRNFDDDSEPIEIPFS